MNSERLRAAGVDYDEGVNRFVGKSALYEKFVGKYPEDASFQTLRDALEQEDVHTAFRAAHTMKGTVANLSFNRLLERVGPLVEALRNEDLAQAKELLSPVETAYRQVIEAIRE